MNRMIRYIAITKLFIVGISGVLIGQEPPEPPQIPSQSDLMAIGLDDGSGEAIGDGKDTEIDPDLDDILNADISQLSRTPVVAPALELEVSTVSRTESTIGKTPAAVFVITPEMIRRSGARTIPELLRLVPGVQVSTITASQSMVAIRGSTGRFSNKLLVQIDGRSVYTPSFGGVFWDVQDLLLDDIERIEVIRGPGGTIWGENAVNGVINILTKHAKQTQGVYAEGGGGSEYRSFAGGRIGGQTEDGAYWRVYGKGFNIDSGFGPNSNDSWRQARTGFRYDKQMSCCDDVTIQGDIYTGNYGLFSLFPIPTVGLVPNRERSESNGGNILLRWKRQVSKDSSWGTHFYYDRTERVNSFITEDRDTIDFDFFHRFKICHHDFVWGLNYRRSSDITANSPVFTFFNNELALDRYSGFVQDRITLVDDERFLWIGTKLSHNEFTGLEVQPNIRYLWTPTPRNAVWASVSRAVRTPSRAIDDLNGTLIANDLGGGTFFTVQGNRDLLSEEVIAYELGYRAQPRDDFSYEMAFFFHRYEDVIGVRSTLNPIVGTIANLTDSNQYGIELNAERAMTDCWRVRGTYSLLKIESNSSSDSVALGLGPQSPRNMATIHSMWDIGPCFHFDLMGRYMDNVPGQNTDRFFTIDSSFICHLTANMDLTVVGRNLLDAQNSEFAFDVSSGLRPTEVQRSVFAMLTYRR